MRVRGVVLVWRHGGFGYLRDTAEERSLTQDGAIKMSDHIKSKFYLDLK